MAIMTSNVISEALSHVIFHVDWGNMRSGITEFEVTIALTSDGTIVRTHTESR